jgi:putative transposase
VTKFCTLASCMTIELNYQAETLETAISDANRFANPTTAPNQLWQTDFTYLKVIGWGWFYLSTVLDDFSRYILAWKLCTTMAASDVSDTLQVALQASGLDQVKVLHRPCLLSDNGPSYVSSELSEWLENKSIKHIRGRAYHPMTQGKIKRYHRSMKNRILLGGVLGQFHPLL